MKKAFTLAEVLITLGIIGVVAAMTLPVLISNYNNKIYINQLKKSYSTFSQGMQKMFAEYNCPDWACMGMSDDNLNDKNYMMDMFSRAFSMADKNTNSGKIDYVTKIYDAGTDTALSANDYLFSFNLPDGSSWYYFGTLFYSNEFVVVVDINGKKKGPNKVGRDVFGMTLTAKGVMAPIFSRNHWKAICSSPVSGHECNAEEMADAYDAAMRSDCSKNGAQENSYISCFNRILLDDWEVNY